MLATHSVAHKGESTSQKTWDFLSHKRRKYRKTFRQCWGFDLKGKVRRSLNFAGSRTKINSTKPFPPSPSRKGSRLNLFVRHNINFSTVELIRQKRLQTDKVCGWLWIWVWVWVCVFWLTFYGAINLKGTLSFQQFPMKQKYFQSVFTCRWPTNPVAEG